nr:unnamed protein product [Digitaria exilis]
MSPELRSVAIGGDEASAPRVQGGGAPFIVKDRCVCHGILVGYNVDVVLDDVKRFLADTSSDVIILEVRTESMASKTQRLGDYLVRQDEQVFSKTITELLPKRVICVQKPRQTFWINTDMPKMKFDSNLSKLSQNPPNTATAVGDNLAPLAVETVTRRIHRCARLFISRVVADGHSNKLQVFSTDFIDEDFTRIDGVPRT